MEERASGIILRTRPLTETSLIVHWITAELGRLSTVAKGARRAKSPFAGKLDLFYEADFSFSRSRRSELHNLRDIQLRNAHSRLREDLGWVNQASYFAVLLERSTEVETPIPELYQLFAEAVDLLPDSKPGASVSFAFELKLLHRLGYGPDFESLSEGSRILANRLLEKPLVHSTEESASDGLLRELNRFLRMVIGSALERIPPQRDRAISF